MVTDAEGVRILTDTERLDGLLREGLIPVECYGDARYTLGEFEGESPREVIDEFLAACNATRERRR